ncbi:putative enzyme related to lactoylglutathione lyase [Saccharothrix tamanrassetensis]|uniref:Putative enzyme related to lactoylglutathione lyase n=1 Tax=Saccharothrix tamanrassetensis TaxID=1051531 RepID=A0A841CDP4_9PSEU|nr:VOC family protein [Saccharothrix tamanrassetensis]MBB5954474.1 putative enzyme related to lactoylglutathione lyase [Saccharothrix tamanrassetensis]
MTSLVQHITIDCGDAYELGQWWSRVTGRPLADDDEPGDPEVLIKLPAGPGLLFIQVPEGKAVKNRVHLDLQPDSTRDEEVERLLGIGATLVDDRRRPDGKGWVVLADPEGNEFCVERSAAERAANP